MYTLKRETIVLSPSVRDFLARLERNIPFDFVITSGTRTASQQAAAMFTKIDSGENLNLLYKDKTFSQGVIDAYPDRAAAEKFIQKYANSGGGSRHLRGLAFDVRTRDLSVEQRNKILQVSNDLGAVTAIYEPVPPHLHIGVKKKPLNLAKLGFLILAIKGVMWLRK